MPVSHRVTMPSHFPMSHAAILSRRHPLQIPPPQFRGSCQCVGSLVSYKCLSLKEFYMFLLGIPTFLNKAKMFMAGIKSLIHVFDNFPL